ncbi:MAG: hypothetical protein R2838_08580 [Caldilineaceae bacterium]
MTERNENELKPTPDTAKSEEVKPVDAEQVRKAKQRLPGTPACRARATPSSPTRPTARQCDNRAVMRHQMR